MTPLYTRFNKFFVALAAALGVLSTGLADGQLTASEIIASAISGLGAFGVYQVKNKPPGTP